MRALGSARDRSSTPRPDPCTASRSASSATAACPGCTPRSAAAASWSGARASGVADVGERAASERRRPVPDRLQHQDLHRGDGHAAARRGPARRSTTCSATTCPRCPTRSRSGSASPTSRAWPASRSATSGRPSRTRPPRSCGATSTTSSGSLRPHDHWHYSNVVYAMLGQLIEELDGRSWEESLRTRLLDPLEMRRTSQRLRRRAPRDRLLRRAVRRRAAARAGDGPQGDWRPAAAWPAPPTTWRSGRRSSPTPATLLSADTHRGDVPAADPAHHRRAGTPRWASGSS